MKSPTIERKSFDLELKSIEDDGSFSMYAAAFGNLDRGGDIIEAGAFVNLDSFVKDGWIALNHRSSDLGIGYPTSAVQDAKGLLIRGQFHSTAEAQACRTVVKERFAAGKSVCASIGYVVKDASYETRGGKSVRILKSLDIYEASFVNLPMNPEADVISAKSLEAETMDDNEKGMIATLRKALGMSSKQGKAISAANHEALSEHLSGMADTVADMKKCVKDFTDKHKAMKEFLDGHAPKDPDDDEDDDEESDDRTDDRPDRGKGKKKSVEPAPVSAVSREDVAREFAAIQSFYR